MYNIHLNESIKTFDCPHCGEKSLTVWGDVSKNGDAHAVYYAGLMTGHQEPSVRLTLSIGGWGVDNPDEQQVVGRSWVFIEARPTSDSYEMMIRDPEESLYFDKLILGKPMSRPEALASPQVDDILRSRRLHRIQ